LIIGLVYNLIFIELNLIIGLVYNLIIGLVYNLIFIELNLIIIELNLIIYL
jgi:hypothetical protein